MAELNIAEEKTRRSVDCDGRSLSKQSGQSSAIYFVQKQHFFFFFLSVFWTPWCCGELRRVRFSTEKVDELISGQRDDPDAGGRYQRK